MLTYLCLIALLTTQVLSTSRYFVGLFYKSYPWAFPLDLCLSSDLGSTYVMYTCSDDQLTLTATTYSDNACTTSSATASYTSADEVEGLYAFNCDGTDDYIKAKFSVGGCTTGVIISGTAYSAINTCFQVGEYSKNSSIDIYEQTQCNSTTATISEYISAADSCDTMSGLSRMVNQSSISTECNYFISGSLGKTKVKIYAELEDCRYNNVTQFPVSQSNSGVHSGTISAYYNLTFDLEAYNADSDPGLCTYDWYSYFTSYFSGGTIYLTTQCEANEGVGYDGYAGIDIKVNVVLYKGASADNCDTVTSAIKTSIAEEFSDVTVETDSCYMESFSSGHMQSMNYFIVLVMFCLGMYIL